MTERIVGAYTGIQYKVDSRDSNTLLYVRIEPGFEILGKPGSLVAVDPSVEVKGKMNFSFKKMLTGGELSFVHFHGPGEVVLAPETWGDIAVIQVDGNTPWYFGKHAFLAATAGIKTNTKAQGLGKALFSGSGLFVGEVTGEGMFFVHSMGGVTVRTLQPGEQWVVNHDHLVAWNCRYNVEKIHAGGLISTIQTGDVVVCRFTGPGTVYLQSRSPEHLIHWIQENIDWQKN